GGPGAARAGAAPGGRAVERCGGGWLCCERPESGSASTGSARASCDEASSSDASTHRPESAEPRRRTRPTWRYGPLPPRRQLALEFNSIGAQLNMLEEEEDLGRVLVARRCHSLGFESEQLLMNHCSQFGRVSRVLVIGQEAQADGPGAAPPGEHRLHRHGGGRGRRARVPGGRRAGRGWQAHRGRALPAPRARAVSCAGHRSRRGSSAQGATIGVLGSGCLEPATHLLPLVQGSRDRPRRLAPTMLRVPPGRRTLSLASRAEGCIAPPALPGARRRAAFSSACHDSSGARNDDDTTRVAASRSPRRPDSVVQFFQRGHGPSKPPSPEPGGGGAGPLCSVRL
ncbi:unnamed protein product, partial [Prorocentrum cordatum]